MQPTQDQMDALARWIEDESRYNPTVLEVHAMMAGPYLRVRVVKDDDGDRRPVTWRFDQVGRRVTLGDVAAAALVTMDDDLQAAIRKAVSEHVGREDWSGDVDPTRASKLDDALRAVLAQLIDNADDE